MTTTPINRRAPRERGTPAPNPTMTSPRRYLLRQVLFVLVVAVLVALLYVSGPMADAFAASPALNSLILGLALFGVVYTIRQVQRLQPEVKWIESYRRGELSLTPRTPPVLLAPMATLLGDETRGRALSTLSMTSLLDSISSRLDESREISRYLTGLLIFLGLLGTFWGLLRTISSVQGALSAITDTGDTTAMFTDLVAGLKGPLSGMGTSFSASLFGLSGALVLGFLDLQTGQAQNRFYNDLEEWLSSITRLATGIGSMGGGDQSIPAYVSALLEQTAESLDSLQRTISRGEENRSTGNAAMMALADRLATLTDSMRVQQDLMAKLAESQMEMRPVLRRMSESIDQDRTLSLDEASRAHLRNLDVYVMRLLEESASGRTQMMEDVRSEIKLLARTMAGISASRRDRD